MNKRKLLIARAMFLMAFGSWAWAGETKQESDSLSKWAGSYDSVSGRCGVLVVQESKITWGSCKEANAKLISVSNSEMVMKVDPSAGQCGWAGFIVALGNEDRGKTPQGITITAYQSLEDYRTDKRFVQCSFSKNEQ